MKKVRYKLSYSQKKRARELAGVSRQTFWEWNTFYPRKYKREVYMFAAVQVILEELEAEEKAKSRMKNRIKELLVA